MRQSLLILAALVVTGCSPGPAEDMLRAARKGESAAPYWFEGAPKTELFNVTEWEMLSARPLEEVAGPIRKAALEYQTFQLGEAKSGLERARAQIASAGGELPKAEARLAERRATPEPTPALGLGTNLPHPGREDYWREIQLADSYVSSLREELRKAGVEAHAREEQIVEYERSVARLGSPVEGTVRKVRVHSTNRAGSPILNTWTVVEVVTPDGPKVTAMYDETAERLEDEHAPSEAANVFEYLTGGYP